MTHYRAATIRLSLCILIMDYFSTFCKYQIFAGTSPKSPGSANPSVQPSKTGCTINIHPSRLVRNGPVGKNSMGHIAHARRRAAQSESRTQQPQGYRVRLFLRYLFLSGRAVSMAAAFLQGSLYWAALCSFQNAAASSSQPSQARPLSNPTPWSTPGQISANGAR